MFFCSFELYAVTRTSLCHLLGCMAGGGGGGGLFTVSATRGTVILFFVRIRAVLLLPYVSFLTFVCYLLTVWCFFGMIISVVDCRQSGSTYNVESSFVEQRQTCTGVSVVCYVCLTGGKSSSVFRYTQNKCNITGVWLSAFYSCKTSVISQEYGSVLSTVAKQV